KVPLNGEVKKVSMEKNSLLKSTLHHSIIPCARQKHKSRKFHYAQKVLEIPRQTIKAAPGI
ncbi:MAG: hypothetical protein PVJ77_18910, partial [Desulfobacterales bacterium]